METQQESEPWIHRPVTVLGWRLLKVTESFWAFVHLRNRESRVPCRPPGWLKRAVKAPPEKGLGTK